MYGKLPTKSRSLINASPIAHLLIQFLYSLQHCNTGTLFDLRIVRRSVRFLSQILGSITYRLILPHGLQKPCLLQTTPFCQLCHSDEPLDILQPAHTR